MTSNLQPIIFGEVLYDCFESGETVLGGAPFNVAWHLQALGDKPWFISRVGNDDSGKKILHSMQAWGMTDSFIQVDPRYQSGYVDIKIIANEPHYTIAPNCAYDFINAAAIDYPHTQGILYHGTLALRNAESRKAYEKLANDRNLAVFFDVNLRTPWWHKNEVLNWLKRAQWVKLNFDELQQLGNTSGDLQQDMRSFQRLYETELLIVTRGAEGALVATQNGEIHSVQPANETIKMKDTVGAGDAFTAMFIHGLIAKWPLTDLLEIAQRFASKIVGIRGATPSDPEFYHAFRTR